jgi:glycosyltransferase involved in cell wall biosynthesis
MNSQDIRTSVIVPAYNMESCLGQTLDTILAQDPKPLEIIVVDDGSTDHTAAVARGKGERITLVQQPNAGEAAARNHGVKLARGEFIAFLDADDYWLPGFLSACQRFLDNQHEAIAVSAGLRFRHFNRADSIFPDPEIQPELISSPVLVIDDFFSFWAKYDQIRSGSSLFRRSVLTEAGGMLVDLKISPDLEYWGYLATFGKWGFIPEILWVCDSERAAVKIGWLKKHRSRRRHCPTVAEWQRRIVARLQAKDWPGFKEVRGRVAASFAQNHILGGKSQLARQIVGEYGEDMPVSWSSHLLRTANRMHGPVWSGACMLLCLREYQKAAFMRLQTLLLSSISSSESSSQTIA